MMTKNIDIIKLENDIFREEEKMLCPICKQEMQDGYLQLGMAICWDRNILKGVIQPRKGEGGFWVTRRPPKCFVQAPYCENCKIIITDLSNVPKPVGLSQRLQKLVKK